MGALLRAVLAILAVALVVSARAAAAENNPPAPLQDGKNLSEELSKRKGVIPPKHEGDSEMVKKAPPAGRTPVIPPPGQRGGPQAK